MVECIFCTNAANSEEDIWPQWILRRVKTLQPIRRQIGNAPARLTKSRRIKVKTVCDKCNNQWMSRLETENLAIIGSLLDNHKSVLNKSQQESLTVWAVKTAMALDSLEKPQFYSKTEC